MSIKTIPNDEPLEIVPLKYKCDKSLGEMHKCLPSSHEFWIFVGASGMGKTTAMTNLISNKGKTGYRAKYNKIWIFMGRNSINSLPENHIFHKYIKDTEECKHGDLYGYVFDEMTPQLLQAALDEAKADSLKNKNTLIIADDQLAVLKNHESERILKEIISNRRHIHCTVWLLSQIFYGIPKSLRGQASVLVLWNPNKREWGEIKEEFFMQFTDKEADAIARFAYKDPHDFLFITTNRLPNKVYNSKFEEIVIE